MTPEQFNQLVAILVKALDGRPGIETVSEGLPADADGTLPEIYVGVDGNDLCLTVSPL
jgi:hypothetical protein